MRRVAYAFIIAVSFMIIMSHASAKEKNPASFLGSEKNPLVFVILPVENVSSTYEKFLPLKDYIERAISKKVILKIAKNYQEAIESIGSGTAHLAYLDPSAYAEARHRYRIIPLAKAVVGGSSTYKSVIVARNDSPLNRIADLKGKRLALGNIWSSSSYLIPVVMLKEVGISLDKFSSVDYLEHEDRIVLSVLSKRHDIGGVSERIANKYLSDGLKILKTSEAIPQYSICAYSGLPEDLRKNIKNSLLTISRETYPEIVTAMKEITGFSVAEDRDFDVMRVIIRNLSGKDYLEYGSKSVKVAILPLYSAITLFDRLDPLMRYLSMKTGHEFKLFIPGDFEDFFEIIRQGKVDFSYSNPYIYIQLADKGHLNALANTVMQSGGDTFRGIIITHKESKIKTLADLRGKRVMIVSYKSAGGFLAQKLFLYENGINVLKDLSLIEGKRQEEVILNVYRKKVDAGFVRESALEVLKEEIDLGNIQILANTPSIANWPFAATIRVDARLAGLVRKSLLELKDGYVLSAAQITGFKLAGDKDYDSLRNLIKKYEGRQN
jgi:phosphonate transport system substrate-binding protein